MSQPFRRRIDVMLEPEYLDGLPARSLDEVRSMLEECVEVETELSYVRRLAQARIGILDAELNRRATGGTLDDLIRSLPAVLTDNGERTPPAQTRLNKVFAPAPSIEWQRGPERLIADDTLVNLPTLSEDEVRATLEQLHELERETSARRRAIHAVMGRLETSIVTRHKVDQSS